MATTGCGSDGDAAPSTRTRLNIGGRYNQGTGERGGPISEIIIFASPGATSLSQALRRSPKNSLASRTQPATVVLGRYSPVPKDGKLRDFVENWGRERPVRSRRYTAGRPQGLRTPRPTRPLATYTGQEDFGKHQKDSQELLRKHQRPK